MPAPTAYTFYGFVEDPFVNDALSNDPAAFGYTPGQTVAGSLTLLGSTAALWTSLPEETVLHSTVELAQTETDFAFQQPGVDWDEADFVTGLTLSSIGNQRPLEQVQANLFTEDVDGPTLRLDQLEFGGAALTNDDGLTAIVSGAWVPAGVDPNLVYGTPEEDVLRASGDLSLVWGGGGEDDIRVRSGEGWLWGGEGDDLIRGNAGRDFVWAGIGDDQVFGQGGDDFIRGEFGDDILEGGAGNDRVQGGSGFDLIRGGAGNDILIGGGGPDGRFGTDTVLGGAGDDVIFSGTGHIDESFELERSVSRGGAGDDIIDATFDAILTGGPGADLFRLGDAALAGISDTLGGLSVTDFASGVDHLAIRAGERYDSFEEIIAAASQQGDSTVFDFFPESIGGPLPDLVLEEVLLSSLTADDFLFGDV